MQAAYHIHYVNVNATISQGQYAAAPTFNQSCAGTDEQKNEKQITKFPSERPRSQGHAFSPTACNTLRQKSGAGPRNTPKVTPRENTLSTLISSRVGFA